MQRISIATCLVLTAIFASSSAAVAEKTFTENFEGDTRPKNWHVNNGHWKPKDGALVCRELVKDNHAGSSRWGIPMQNGVVELKLRFAGAKFFHVGFDPARGELKKKGHLYSLVLMPNKASIVKHLDKNDPKSKNEVLATTKLKPANGEWINVRLETAGEVVNARISSKGAKAELTATDETFGVKKPTVVFRVKGGDVILDEIAVVVKK